MNSRGRFIVVEGMEGAGKSTVIQVIKNFLESKQNSVLLTREPGGTRIGEKIRAIMKEPALDQPLEHRAELLLMYASRVQLLEQVIRPALEDGVWIISDRFELSSFAYQGGGRGINQKILQELSDFCLAGFEPDLTFFLDINPAEGLERTRSRGAADRIEQESILFFERVYQAYLQKIRTMNNVIMIDASQALDTVHEQIITELNTMLQRWRASD